MNNSKFLIVGSDPESFIRDRQGKLVSAIGIIPGSKRRPTPTPHGSIQPDNITAEFNSKPSSSLEEFISNHKLIISDLEDVLKPLDLHLDFISSVMADPSLLSHPDARKAGCEPDYCVWQSTSPRLKDYVNKHKPDYDITNLRAAGGHLHISFDQAGDDLEPRFNFVKALDMVLGVPSVILDTDNTRRTMYGQAGAFRPKFLGADDPYDGMEYRTLSNFWLRSEELMAWAYNGVRRVYDNLEELSDIATRNGSEIVSIINEGNKEKAINFCNNFGVNYAY